MKFTHVAAITCFVIAGALAANGKTEWGWFLFVGVLIY